MAERANCQEASANYSSKFHEYHQIKSRVDSTYTQDGEGGRVEGGLGQPQVPVCTSVTQAVGAARAGTETWETQAVCYSSRTDQQQVTSGK